MTNFTVNKMKALGSLLTELYNTFGEPDTMVSTDLPSTITFSIEEDDRINIYAMDIRNKGLYGEESYEEASRHDRIALFEIQSWLEQNCTYKIDDKRYETFYALDYQGLEFNVYLYHL